MRDLITLWGDFVSACDTTSLCIEVSVNATNEEIEKAFIALNFSSGECLSDSYKYACSYQGQASSLPVDCSTEELPF
jgi:hypothetical protein